MHSHHRVPPSAQSRRFGVTFPHPVSPYQAMEASPRLQLSFSSLQKVGESAATATGGETVVETQFLVSFVQMRYVLMYIGDTIFWIKYGVLWCTGA